MLSVLAAGTFATVQDRGRPGLAHLGVTRSGAADRAAHDRANRVVGNAAAAATVEAVLGGLRLFTDHDRVVAVAGAGAGVRIGNRLRPAGRALRWPAGETLALDPPVTGLRSYLAVRGGVAVAPVLGSRSTDTLGGLGPAPLRTGDTLPVGDDVAGPPAPRDALVLPPAGELRLPIGPGPRADWFDVETLLATPWEVGVDADRVGVRLVGPPLRPRRSGELPSEGVVRGAVQVPPAGRPVVFGPDHPTTGGYPVVAVLTPAASDRLAQARPGTRVRFTPR